MNEQFIRSVVFDWEGIDETGYVKKIAAFQGLDSLELSQPITFFVGEKCKKPFLKRNGFCYLSIVIFKISAKGIFAVSICKN